jgi:hypothetical protein
MHLLLYHQWNFDKNKQKISPKIKSFNRQNYLIKSTKTFTFNGSVRRIEEKTPDKIDVNHFWLLISPNSIPRPIMNIVQTPINIKQIP